MKSQAVTTSTTFSSPSEETEIVFDKALLSTEALLEHRCRKTGHIPHQRLKETFLTKAINAVGMASDFFGHPLIQVKEKELFELLADEGKDIPELGDQSAVVRRMKTFFSEIDFDNIPHASRIGISALFLNSFKSRINMFRFVRQNPSICEIKLKPMIFIAGQPRTGSTLLQSLLGSVPRARCLRNWEFGVLNENMPPATTRKQTLNDPRIESCQQNFDRIGLLYEGYWDNLWKSHYMAPKAFDEDTLFLTQAGIFITYVPLASFGLKYQEDLAMKDVSDAYRFIRLFYKVFQSGFSPKSHWVSKSPFHALYLNELTQSIPEARVVLTHRNPVYTIPSYAALTEALIGHYFQEGDFDRRVCGRFSFFLAKVMVDRIIEFQKTADPKTYINVKYEETVKQPLEVAERIHKHFGLEFDEIDAKAIKKQLSGNPQGKHGRANYSLEQFGLTKEEVEAEMGTYIKMFC